MFSIPAVVSITLLTSWVLALTLSPLLAYLFIRPTEGPRSPVEWIASKMPKRQGGPDLSPSSLYGRFVSLCLAAKAPVLAVTLLLLAAAVMLPIGTQFFPQDNRDMFFVDIWLPEGSSWEATERAAARVEGLLQEVGAAGMEDEAPLRAVADRVRAEVRARDLRWASTRSRRPRTIRKSSSAPAIRW